MAERKTQRNDGDVDTFLNGVENERRRSDSFRVRELMSRVTGERAEMWGDSIVGFGSYSYRYSSGREGTMPLVGFSPRKQALTLYIMSGFDRYEELLSRLGKHSTGKSCLYVKKLDEVDEEVLEELVRASVQHMKATNPGAA